MLARLLAALSVLAAIVIPAPANAVAAPAASMPAPPMGWASWNSFAAQINYNVIKTQADALVSTGMAKAGYQYVNIDEGWWQGTRDSAGNITVDPKDWPGGMSAIAAYIHSKGLKAGIYTDAGKNGCGYYYPTGRPAAPGSGSEGHYLQDMTQFERWGFDYVKVDWCGGNAEHLDPATAYRSIATAIRTATATTGHGLVLSICDWGDNAPWNWGPGTGTLWRTSQDIVYWGQNASFARVLGNFDQAQHPTAEHTGYYNDPDMLVAGMTGLSDDQARTHLSLWAMSGAPLLAGNNLVTTNTSTAQILTNPEVIAVDQDPRELQGVQVAQAGSGLQVYGKVLSGSGRRAVLLLNRTSTTATMTVHWSDLGLAGGSAAVRNLWTRRDLGTFTGAYSTSVPAGSSVLLSVSGTEGPSSTYHASGGVFAGVRAAANGIAVATISYTGGGSTATLQVDGQTPTAVNFPAAASGSVSVEVSLTKGSNTLTVTGATGLTSAAIMQLPAQS
ncbi:MAG TPA: alpha-galactosidase [Pseudonocardiaceae bacterium]|nr:alpha-galactosidase [Pseudonocardiaceae bacterium]